MADTLFETCQWCDRLAVYQCDYILPAGRPGAGGPLNVRTCSALMCEVHRFKHSSGLVKLAPAKGRPGGCQPFTIDFCPDHAPKPVSSPAAA